MTRWMVGRVLLTAAAGLLSASALPYVEGLGDPGRGLGAPAGAAGAAGIGVVPAAQDAPQTLEETKLTLGKWIETQQIISKERNEWQQGQEVLRLRLELVKKEVATLQEQIATDQASVAEANAKRDELVAQNDELKAAGARLNEAVTGMEAEVRTLTRQLPEPLQTTLEPLSQRIPTDAATTKVSAAERFQNVLGILDALNKANNEITVSYEVRTLAGGAPSEVKAIYIGLAQAYYVSARGEAGTGRPGPDGWVWQPSATIANDVLTTLEILDGKHTPAFVPLPVTIQ